MDPYATACKAGRDVCEHTFVPSYRYTVHEYDPDKPWLIVSTRIGLTVELERAGDFTEWAREHWPHPHYAAALDPGQHDRLM